MRISGSAIAKANGRLEMLEYDWRKNRVNRRFMGDPFKDSIMKPGNRRNQAWFAHLRLKQRDRCAANVKLSFGGRAVVPEVPGDLTVECGKWLLQNQRVT
jgi:hypothetical protein